MKTIAAIATAINGAINIIRVSGDQAIEIVNKIYSRDLSKMAANTINYGHIISDGKIIDEVLVSVFKAPRSYTAEDLVEINSHGGPYLASVILELLLANGAELALPGEFTKRAYINGRIDLVQASSVDMLIKSKNSLQHQIAINQLSSKHQDIIKPLENEILGLIANIAVNIDYPEYDDILEVNYQYLNQLLPQLIDKLNKIIIEANSLNQIKHPIKTVIIGKANVGKSSLLNALIKEEKAIVSDIAGTTRDIVEGEISINNLSFHLIDTAGFRQSEDLIENLGIKKSIDMIEKADFVIVLIDAMDQLDEQNKLLIEKAKIANNHLVVYNKMDLKYHDGKINISAANKDIAELKTAISDLFKYQSIDPSIYALSSTREIGKLMQARSHLQEALNNLAVMMSVDMIEIDLKLAYQALVEISQDFDEDTILNKLFSEFCLGK